MSLVSSLKRSIKIINDPHYRLRVLIKYGMYDSLSDAEFLETVFPKYMGYPLNLDNPKTFSEKLQWLKIHDRNPIYTDMVDKYEAKQFIEKKVGNQFTIPTLAVYDCFDDIDFESLPNQFVLKCTHDSGGIVICKDKKILNIEAARKQINKSLHRNFYKIAREWPYKNVKPRIIAETYMAALGNDTLLDYKMYVFHGEPKLTVVCSERFSSTGTRMDFYDINWDFMDLTLGHYYPSKRDFPKPEHYEKMKEVCRVLGENIPFVRVDFYEVNGKLYIGELTFFPGAGLETITPIEQDYKLGEWLHLENVHRS